jgi:hypothetical protein
MRLGNTLVRRESGHSIYRPANFRFGLPKAEGTLSCKDAKLACSFLLGRATCTQMSLCRSSRRHGPIYSLNKINRIQHLRLSAVWPQVKGVNAGRNHLRRDLDFRISGFVAFAMWVNHIAIHLLRKPDNSLRGCRRCSCQAKARDAALRRAWLIPLMAMGGKKRDDAESDKGHEGAKSDHKKIEHGHDAPEDRFALNAP